MRVKNLPTFHKNKPDIAFFAKVESRCWLNAAITQLASEKGGKIYTDNKNIIDIAKHFYTRGHAKIMSLQLTLSGMMWLTKREWR